MGRVSWGCVCGSATPSFFQACDFLQRRECDVIQFDAETLEVELPHELHPQQARLELDLYLRVWQPLHEWPPVDYVDELEHPHL